MSRPSMQRLIVRPARLPVIARAVMGGALVVAGFVLLGALGVFDDRGATVSGFPVGIIPWSEIRGAELRQVSRAKVLSLELRHPERLVERLPAPRRHLARLSLALGWSPVRLAVSGTDAAPDAVLAFIREQVARRAGTHRAVS